MKFLKLQTVQQKSNNEIFTELIHILELIGSLIRKTRSREIFITLNQEQKPFTTSQGAFWSLVR